MITSVRITAARQFKAIVDDFEFQVDSFLPYAPDILGRNMTLIQEVENTETKLVILETIRIIAVRLETHISPYADQIVSILPGLWEASGEEHLLKQAILTIMSTLVTSMQGQSERYHSLILPLIQRAVEPGSEMQVYLMEEALELWSQILAQSSSPASPEVLALIDCAFPLLELAPEAMLGDANRLRILSYMTSLLGVTKRDLAGLVTTAVEDLIRAAEKLGGLLDAWEAHQTTGPDRRYPKLDDVVETDYFTILARIALADPTVFANLLASIDNGNFENTWKWLSEEWFRHFDSMANIDRQKLSCLAITRLLELPPPMTPIILTKLQDFFAMWTSVISEMMREFGPATEISLAFARDVHFPAEPQDAPGDPACDDFAGPRDDGGVEGEAEVVLGVREGGGGKVHGGVGDAGEEVDYGSEERGDG
ncbi:hypothetical protein DID88_002321 [Monilinia fructigena]|uniref:Importin-7/11-like TPR repeats domain-containing protein n=1 Tax=Monilinia fructigena TaxID=38457 RepID=A0A395IDA0_9HELO|nr:hypothetical protein DID88_002321 [Monilinia fructigena]